MHLTLRWTNGDFFDTLRYASGRSSTVHYCDDIMHRFRNFTLAALLTFAAMLTPRSAVAAINFNSYHVGNSLTGQHVSSLGDDIAPLAADRGVNLNWADHILCGSTLTNIVANPTTTCLTPSATYGYFGTALPNFTWDAVTLEAYGDPFNSARSSVSTLIDLTRTNPNNAATKFYLLQIWPQGASSDDFATRWNRAYDPTVDDLESRWSRLYSLDLLASARADRPGVQIGMVPTTEVLYQLDQLAKAGKISAFTSGDQLYIDGNHLNSIGCYIARMTLMSTMLDQSPVGLPLQNTVSGLSAADTQLIQQTVWNVVSANSTMTLVPEPASVSFLFIGAAVLYRRGLRSARRRTLPLHF